MAKVAKKSEKKTDTGETVEAAVAALRSHATKATLDGMARYGLPSTNAFGVPVGKIQLVAKELGRDHELAEGLWQTGHYEARMLAAFVDDPTLVTPAQMDRWCRDFDNWGICDTVCFHLFDRTPHAFKKIVQWAGRNDEFVRRGAFALLASVALHDKRAEDAAFLKCLPLVEEAASDERNFVKKGVSWALRGIGGRNIRLHAASVELAERLAASPDTIVRWVGKDVLRDINRPAKVKKLQEKK